MFSTFNYRIVHIPDKGYGLFEIYYDSTGEPSALTVEPLFDYFDTKMQVINDLQHMLEGTMRGVMQYDDDGFSYIEPDPYLTPDE